ncbi:MAG: class I SAM-dependent methyltransferase [Candidatus Thermoplasmatota archaeon]|nr:class I SAM-dependent methyltransferase [Euryarchaeota archaeon]MBU4031718.1 class I SAM-dependent methyltransferase [Candidatus Thermoplasmatota archaeon]MBU4070675.1 class I SAM-dependent methyltransferase [Candidatus Thermoplasmatota archaeon]MBU4591772.1 class I SAM-dependent methyltransferase [Candidatus Thermoplasmatota archaeon]
MAERYAQWAKYYDMMGSDELTQREMGFFEWAFETYGLGKDTMILDATCGTGRHVFPLLEKGYSVVANDLSPDMLGIAKEKAKRKGMKVVFTNHDMRELTFKNEFDAVMTINSAFNYMMTDEDASRALGCFFKALKDGGMLILDVQNFLDIYEDFKKVIEKQIEADGIKIKRKSTHSVEDRVKCIFRHQEDDTIIIGNRTEHVNEVHLLRMFNYHELKRLILGARFGKIMCFGSFDDREEAKKNAERLIFVAIK